MAKPYFRFEYTESGYSFVSDVDYCRDISCRIFEVRRNGSRKYEEYAGKIRGFLVDIAFCRRIGFPVEDAFDGHCNTSDLYEEALSVPGVDLSIFGEVMRENVLLIHRIELLPAYRGKSLGLAALDDFLNRCGGSCGLCFTKPFPLQFSDMVLLQEGENGPLQLGRLPQDMDASVAKLRGYYARLGFRPLKGTEYLALNLEKERPGFKGGNSR